MRVMLLLCALFLAPHTALGQTNEGLIPDDPAFHQQADSDSSHQQMTPPAQAGAGKSTAPERWRYDPSAKPGVAQNSPFQESPIERALKGVNPRNVPYGGLLAEWRLALVRETIENFYYWALLTLIAVVILESFYILWLQRQREERLQIAGNIVAQLWNAHVFARREALDAIEAHNKLVEELDAIDEAAESQTALRTSGLPAGVDPAATTDSESPVEPNNGMREVPTAAFDPEKTDERSCNNGIPLQVKAAEFAQSLCRQPPAKRGEAEAIVPAEAPGSDAESSVTDDVDALKLALQKTQAQLATKDVQLRAKDDKIASQRQLISDLNSRPRGNGDGGSGAN